MLYYYALTILYPTLAGSRDTAASGAVFADGAVGLRNQLAGIRLTFLGHRWLRDATALPPIQATGARLCRAIIFTCKTAKLFLTRLASSWATPWRRGSLFSFAS